MDLPFVEALEPAPAAQWRDGDAWLAGGTWLFSEPQPHTRRLLDLHAFGWPALSATDDTLQIAATCTLAELHAYAPPARWPAAALFARACESLLGSFKIWNMATVGGNICMALPAGPMTSLTAALDGVCTVWTAEGSSVELPVAAFVTGNHVNALAPGALLRSVTLREPALKARTALRRFSKTTGGRTAALVIGRVDPDGTAVLTVTAAITRPVQLRFPALPSAAELESAVDGIAPALYFDDAHGTATWRAWLTRLLAEEIRAELESA